ncbi:MAG: DNA-3-methyladenine glycosylase I [Anaerolineae bacterium]|nr:DNA-3-methyladenine glycosylase I [Anaerolineae bacterium]
MSRCPWATSALMIAYHDEEWGVPQHDDRTLFEFLILESAQAGLSWETILKKREHYRLAFDDFDAAAVAQYSEQKIAELLQNPGIVRNQRKIRAAIQNARAYCRIQQEFGSFDAFVWKFVGRKPIRNRWRTIQEIPAFSPESNQLSKELQKRGFSFVGPTICYAFMQAVGMVNDHLITCFRYDEVNK